MMARKIRYSEIFGNTIQGEGYYTGMSTVWLRVFGCNLTCGGFGQKDPTDRASWIEPYQEIDATTIKRMEDLPVFEVGCDSGYSWSKQFRHLAHEDTAEDIAFKLQQLNVNEYNPEGLWRHPITDQEIHMCFTGGEPMMQQGSIIDVLNAMIATGNYPKHVTIETNATQKITEGFRSFWVEKSGDIELTFSMSPKLTTVSGEDASKAWKMDVIQSYHQLAVDVGGRSYVKMVVNEKSFDELESNVRALVAMNKAVSEGVSRKVNLPLYAMPVGATLEEQEDHPTAFYDKLIAMGLNISDRVHVRIYGNVVGK